MKTKIICLLLTFSMLNYLSAQTNVTDKLKCTVKGCVVNSLSKEFIPYATLRIALASSPREDVKLSTCDENGKFVETMDIPGDYVLTIQSLGKQTINKHFKIDKRQKEIDLGNLSMKESVQNLKGVTVSAQKPLVKMDIDKLTYNMEDDPESKTNNTLDMFRKVPLVTVDGDDKIQLKGSSNYKIFLNGKPSNLLSGGNASEALKSMPANSIKNIEVIIDPGAKYDAEGLGGIINIVTVRNKLQGYAGTVRANASSFGTFGVGGYLP